MAVNRGKQFEDQIRSSFEAVENTSVKRLIDPQNGYAGVRNECDFIVYHYPYEYHIECKSVHGNTMSIHSNDPKKRYGMITNNQWEGLLKASKIKGVIAGVIVWFVDHDETYFFPIEFLQAQRDKGFNSLAYYPNWDILNYTNWFRIKGTKRRVLFDYHMKEFFEDVERSIKDRNKFSSK